MLNKLTLIGRIGKDPKKEEFNGRTKLSFSVATDSFSGKGEKGEPDWHNCQLWGDKADTIGKYLAKGRLVYIEGRSKTWAKQVGEQTFRIPFVDVFEVKLLDSKKDFEAQMNNAVDEDDDESGDNIPF